MSDRKEINKSTVKKIEETVDWIAEKIEKMKSIDYIYFTDHPYKRLWNNFLNGIAKGVGSAIGFSVVFALLLMLLRWIADINLPIISTILDFILDAAEKK